MASSTMSGVNSPDLTKNKGEKSQELLMADEGDVPAEETDDTVEQIFRQDPDIFLLNNILMSVQFFENYERDIRRLREKWFRDFTLSEHHKKCFQTDSLFRLAGANVKFSPRHGMHEDSETTLHPHRIYIFSDHIEAAFDPSALQKNEGRLCPQYQFTVSGDEKNRNAGCVQLIEYKTIKASNKIPKATSPRADFSTSHVSPTAKPEQKQNYIQLRRNSSFYPKSTRRLTETEKFIGLQNNRRLTERRGSLNFVPGSPASVISMGDFYKFMSPEARVKPKTIHEFRMNTSVLTSCEIPLSCFQREEVKWSFNAGRRTGLTKNELNGVFRSQNVLNSAAFKGYFCDLLVERLAGTLTLDNAALSKGSVLEEFIRVNQSGIQFGIAPVIPIRDWNNFIVINKRTKNREKQEGLQWPSRIMQKIMHILPCYAVPGHYNTSEENLDYEKEWTLVFPKAEEFLLLHMMHAHIRCYFFALLIYKSFLETEINAGSLGPKHLLHLIFWRVQKNFLAWPEDRPGETLLIFLKALYKKIQNKCLSDFFVTSRNMFATSLPNDLHKAQTLIKKVIENPIPCIIRALRHLQIKSGFYPPLDVLKLHAVLSHTNVPKKPKKIKKEKKEKVARSEGDDDDDDLDEERQWKKNAIRQIELERKLNEESSSKLSFESVNIDEEIRFDTGNHKKCTRVLEMFLLHFLEMREKSLQFEFSSQALSYSSHAKKLFDLMVSSGGNKTDMQFLKAKLNQLTDNDATLKRNRPEPIRREKQSAHVQRDFVRGNATQKKGDSKISENIYVITEEPKNESEWSNSSDDTSDQEVYMTRL